MPPDKKETKLGSSYTEASPSTDKNTKIVCVMSCMEVCPYISCGVDISDVTRCHLLRQISSQ